MIGVAVAENDRVDPADVVEIQQPARLGTLAAIEQQPAAVGLDHERRGFLGP